MEVVKGPELKEVEEKDQSVNGKGEPSYDQLKNIAIQAVQQVEMYKQELQKVQDERVLIRLEFLFKIINSASTFPGVFSEETVNKAAEEITAIMFPSDEVKE